LYFGAAIAAVVAALTNAAGLRTRAAFNRRRATGTALLAAALPAVFTILYEWFSGTMPSHTTRAVSGAVLGAAVSVTILSVLRDQVN
jgi:hypothetical protein